MISLEVFGVEATAAYLKDGVRLFKLEQRKKMRLAAKLVQVAAIHQAQNIFASRGAHRGASGKMIGPLDRNIRVKIINTTADVVALIRPKASAFYGRFQETGLNVQRKGRTKGNAFLIGSRKATKGSHPFRLPARPFLAPAIDKTREATVAIMGESYDVFYRGGA